jgi:hypothetical protein
MRGILSFNVKIITMYCPCLDDIIVRMPNVLSKNDPVDISFLSYKHPGSQTIEFFLL